MKELVRITPQPIGKNTTQTCSARELHQFLEVGSQFADWIKGRIEEYGYRQGKDFEVFQEIGKNPLGGRPAREYILTLDMAKELAMVEKNSKGRLVRRYFINCERAAVEQMPRLAEELLARHPRWRQIKRYKEMGLNHVEIARLVGSHVSRIRREVRNMEACGLLAPPADLAERQAMAQRLLPGLEGRS